MSAQTTSRVIMVRPSAFGFNVETAANNTFQHQPREGQDEIRNKAMTEFDHLVHLLRHEGVDVMVIEDSTLPVKPDAVFPNNWISFHENGTVVTYPMFSPLRRLERREDIVAGLANQFVVRQRLAMEYREAQHHYLEGTGSMVLDRVNHIAYACISPRTDMEVLNEWCTMMGYKAITFEAMYDQTPIYHTNVMMAIGDGVCVICMDVIEASRRKAVMEALQASGRDVVVLKPEQIGSFAGNMLALRTQSGEQIMVMSRTADLSLDQEQRAAIERHARIVSSDVHTIESIGGGSVRCMIAENFLPHL